MKINVTENKVSIKEEQILNENEYNIHKIQFDFSSEYTDDLVKVALFSIDNHTYKKIISNNECDIPPEVLTQRGYSILGVYAYKTEQDTLVLRYSPSPTKISVYDGSYKADAENSEPITPSEIEQYQQILQNSLQQFQNQYNALVEETEGDIQAIEDELQRKVDEGYFDGEDGFSPIAKVIQKSNGATIEIEDKNGKTTADVLNGEDGYTPVRGVDYWTEEDKQEVEEEATQQIEGKIEEYNENAAEKLNQYNQNSVQKTNDYNTNTEQKMSAYNTNATEKLSTYNSNATEKFNDYNLNAEQKETNYNTNASSKLSEYNSNAETKKSAYDENATQKTNSFNTNATNKLTEYNTNHTEKMSAYNSNSTEKLNAFNENATQKTEDFDEHTEQIQTDIEVLQRTDDEILSNFNKFDEVTGEDITLNETTEIKFAKPPLPRGNSEQDILPEQYQQVEYIESTGTQYINTNYTPVENDDINIEKVKNTGTGCLFSAGNSTNQLILLASSSTNYYWKYFATGNATAFFTEELSSFSTISTANGSISINNVVKASSTYAGTVDTTIQLFRRVNGESYATVSIGRFTITNGNKTKLDLIPCYRISDNEVGMYDLVSNTFYTNAGTGTFNKGNNTPNPDYPQEITNVTGDVEVKVQNKNFFDINSFESQLVSGKIINDNGVEVSDATSTYSRYKLFLRKNVTYYIKGAWQRIYYYDMNGNLKSRSSAFNGANRSYTPSENEYIGFQIGNTYWSSNKGQEQIEQNSTSTNFVKHKEQILPLTLGNIELCKIGDYQDYFYKESNKWYLHKEINKTVYNGSENWNYNAQNNVAYLQLTSKAASRKRLLSNFFSYYNAGWATAPNNTISEETSSNFIFIKSTVASDNTAWKNWLSIHNTIVYYVLAIPTDTEITDTILISQLEAINNAISYEEQTNISGSSNGSNPIFTVQAYKSLNKELNNKVDEEGLTDYVKNTDYATAQKGGVIKNANGLQISNGGATFAYNYDYNTYLAKDAGLFIGKGTLENVIAGKQLINQTQLDNSQEELFDVYNYSFVKNVSDNIFTTTENDTVQDKIFSIATGELSGNTYQNYLAFINYIEIKSNKNYYFALYNQNNTFNTLIGCIACFYDKNKNFISGLQISGTNQPIISPANAKYLRISISKTYYTNFKFLVSEDSYPQTYSDYFEKYYTLNKKLLINYNDIIVDVNGSGDFTTIQQAFEYIESKKDNNYHNRYNIYIKEGNYDLGANLSNEDLNNSNVSGVTVPDYTYLIGLGNKKNIVLYCTFNDKQQYISTLNLKGSCGLENITVIGTKTRYAIHVDTLQSSEYHQIIKNCIIKGVETYYSVVYGTGTYDNAYWEFSDTIFDGTETGNNGVSGIPFSVHNSLNASGNRFIKFTNCRFKTNSTNKNAILFKTLAYRPNNPSESANNMVTYVEIYGCKFGGNGFSLVEENPTYYGTGCLYYITGYGNDNALYEIVTTDGIDYSDRVDII